MNKVNLLSKLQGCLCGVAIGDAMGMPWEMMTTNEIFFATQGQGVRTFSDAKQIKISETSNLKAGEITDDWQLTSALANAIISAGSLDYITIAKKHIIEFDHSTTGWGKSTKKAISTIKDYFNSLLFSGKKPDPQELQRLIDEAIVDTPGTGNGVAMKIAPMALYHFGLDTSYLFDNVFGLGKMTHRDPRASYAACAIAGIIKMVLESHQPITIAKSIYLDSDLINELVKLEVVRSYCRPHQQFSGDSFVSRLINIFTTDILNCPLDKTNVPADLIKQVGTSCLSLESIPFSIAIFLRNLTNFQTGILEAVNSGGDTDTNASLVGAMIGTNVGLEGIPPEWISQVLACQEALVLANQLYDELLQGRKI